MKMYFSIQKDTITFLGSRRKVDKGDIVDASIEVANLPLSVDGVIFNGNIEAISFARPGNDFVDICLKVEIKNQSPELIVINDGPMTRNNQYYKTTVQKAKALQKMIH